MFGTLKQLQIGQDIWVELQILPSDLLNFKTEKVSLRRVGAAAAVTANEKIPRLIYERIKDQNKNGTVIKP